MTSWESRCGRRFTKTVWQLLHVQIFICCPTFGHADLFLSFYFPQSQKWIGYDMIGLNCLKNNTWDARADRTCRVSQFFSGPSGVSIASELGWIPGPSGNIQHLSGAKNMRAGNWTQWTWHDLWFINVYYDIRPKGVGQCQLHSQEIPRVWHRSTKFFRRRWMATSSSCSFTARWVTMLRWCWWT